jgi:Protein of unknown function (DUF1579)
MLITCRRSLSLVAALLALATSAFSADLPLDSPEQKVLDKWVGRWRTSYKLPKAEWTPEEKTGTAELTTSRVVGGRFVQDRSEHSDKTSTSSIFTYDAAKKCYRGWWFSSTGHTSESTGKWDGDSKTMTWNSVGEAAFTTTVRYHFVDDDHTEWDVTVKDPTGKLLYRLEGTSGRVKERKK